MSQARLEFLLAEGAIRGERANQEDSRRVWRPVATSNGGANARPVLAVLADGMGGHVSGEVASKLACEQYVKVFSSEPGSVAQRLDLSLNASNDALRTAIGRNQGLNGMGCTMVAGYLDQDGLRWVSIGDSQLLRFRGTELRRLNEDHSLGAILDKHAQAGLISADEARLNPRRRTLRAAVTGGDISLRELVREPEPVRSGDWIIFASDGLESLSGDQLSWIIRNNEDEKPEVMVDALLKEVEKLRVQNQDNTTIIAIRVIDPADPHSKKTRLVDRTPKPGDGPVAQSDAPTMPVPKVAGKRARSSGRLMMVGLLTAALALTGLVAVTLFSQQIGEHDSTLTSRSTGPTKNTTATSGSATPPGTGVQPPAGSDPKAGGPKEASTPQPQPTTQQDTRSQGSTGGDASRVVPLPSPQGDPGAAPKPDAATALPVPPMPLPAIRPGSSQGSPPAGAGEPQQPQPASSGTAEGTLPSSPTSRGVRSSSSPRTTGEEPPRQPAPSKSKPPPQQTQPRQVPQSATSPTIPEPPAPPPPPPPSAFGKGEKLEPPAKAKKPDTHEDRN